MSTLAAEGPNAEQIEYWNADSGAKWVSHQERLDAQIEPAGRLAMERAGVAEGEHVLDVGCGCGGTTLELARRVGARGSVLGIDISSVMLARARERAAGLSGVRFLNADAETHAFDPGARDLVYSRFGVMFFADPVRAFANLRRALRPGGRTVFVCWRPLPENPWALEPLRALASFLTLPEPPPPGAPGPFAFADAERVRRILEGAGFDAPEIAPHDLEMPIGGGVDLDRSVEFALTIGPAARVLAQAGEAHRARAAEVLREALAPHADERGVVLPGAVWVVSAGNPG